MASVVYLPQPTLEVTLEAGGNLPAGTTYYFTGCYCGFSSGGYVSGLYSAVAEEVSITTDSTYKSIRIKFKWWNGSSWQYTYPTYASGTLVKWDYVSLKSGGIWKKTTPWKFANAFIGSFGLEKLITDESQISGYTSTEYYHPQIADYYNSYPTWGDYSSGTPVLIIDSDSDTITTIRTALNGDTKNLCRAAILQGVNYIYMVGEIYFKKAISLSNVYFHLINNGMRADSNITPSFTACVFFFEKCYPATYNIPVSNLKTCAYLNPRPGLTMSSPGTYNQVFSFESGIEISSITASNLFAMPFNFNGRIRVASMNNYELLTDSVVYQGALFFYTTNLNYMGVKRIKEYYDKNLIATVKDLWINDSSSTLTMQEVRLVDFVMETNRPASEGIDYTGEKKPRIYWERNGTALQDYSLNFYYTLKFKIYSPSGVLQGVTIDVNDGAYTGETDSNGYCEISYLGRVARRHPSYPTGTTYYTQWTDYLNLTIKISKTGYRTETLSISGIDDIINFSMKDVLLLPELKINTLSFTHPTQSNNNGTITVQASGGVAPYQYSIDDGATWQSSGEFTGLTAGDYIVKVKDNEGIEVDGVTVTLKKTDYIDLKNLEFNLETNSLEFEIEPEPSLTFELY